MKMLTVLLSYLAMLGCTPVQNLTCPETALTPVPPEMIEQLERILRQSSDSASDPLAKSTER